jgi:hypothetical protein
MESVGQVLALVSATLSELQLLSYVKAGVVIICAIALVNYVLSKR